MMLAQMLREAYFYQVCVCVRVCVCACVRVRGGRRHRGMRAEQIEELIRLIETKQRKSRRIPISRDSVLMMLHSAPRLQLPSTCMAGRRVNDRFAVHPGHSRS